MMITTTRLYAPTRALPAIAAALALSSTPVLAQEAQPATTAPATTAQPVPDTPAPATDTSTTAPATDTSTAATTTKRSVKRTVRTTRVSAAKPAPVATRTATRIVTKRAAAPAATAAAAPKPASAPAPAPAPAPQTAAAPVVQLPSKPAPAPAKTASSKPIDNETLEIAGGGLLALILVGGTASTLIGRRRRRREQEEADAQTLALAPVEETTATRPEPVIHQEEPAGAASAFAWGNQARADDSADDQDDRRPGESWVERAYRGPSPSNPSASLRNRLSRAAFFDKREREAAAGTAEPVDTKAGLPQAMVDEQEREPA